MISYEVIVTVNDAERSAEYEAWLRSTHIPDIMKTGCFTAAELSRESPTRFRTRYVAANRSTLERYFVEYAPELRAETRAMLVSDDSFDGLLARFDAWRPAVGPKWIDREAS